MHHEALCIKVALLECHGSQTVLKYQHSARYAWVGSYKVIDPRLITCRASSQPPVASLIQRFEDGATQQQQQVSARLQ